MSKQYIVYQGYGEQWRWREVDENRNTIALSELFPTTDDAFNDCVRHDPDGEIIEVQKPADFSKAQPVPEATE